MFVKVEPVGLDKLLKATVYTETRVCDQCHKLHSFSYSCSYDLATVRLLAKKRMRGCVGRDLCIDCEGLESQGWSQPRLL